MDLHGPYHNCVTIEQKKTLSQTSKIANFLLSFCVVIQKHWIYLFLATVMDLNEAGLNFRISLLF